MHIIPDMREIYSHPGAHTNSITMASQSSQLVKNRTNIIFSLFLPPKLSREKLESLMALFYLSLCLWKRLSEALRFPSCQGKGKKDEQRVGRNLKGLFVGSQHPWVLTHP